MGWGGDGVGVVVKAGGCWWVEVGVRIGVRVGMGVGV